jgi:hypothetical protein
MQKVSGVRHLHAAFRSPPDLRKSRDEIASSFAGDGRYSSRVPDKVSRQFLKRNRPAEEMFLVEGFAHPSRTITLRGEEDSQVHQTRLRA